MTEEITKVFYIKDITPDNLVKMYEKIIEEYPDKDLRQIGEKRVACKVHSGEKGCCRFLKPDYLEKMVNYVNGKICECNAAYAGGRFTFPDHWKVMEDHKFIETFGRDRIDLMDEEGYEEVKIEDGHQIKANYLGKHMLHNYDSMLVLARFKGHDIGGFGKFKHIYNFHRWNP